MEKTRTGRPRSSERGLTVSRVREVLHYDPETGWLTWKIPGQKRRVGARVGCPRSPGDYRTVGLDGAQYYEHRVIWLWWHGEWPDEIDHRNRQKDDNRLENLRIATRAQNTANSPHNGRCRQRKCGKFEAYITLNYKYVYLGMYDTREEAAAVSLRAAVEARGEFGI